LDGPYNPAGKARQIYRGKKGQKEKQERGAIQTISPLASNQVLTPASAIPQKNCCEGSGPAWGRRRSEAWVHFLNQGGKEDSRDSEGSSREERSGSFHEPVLIGQRAVETCSEERREKGTRRASHEGEASAGQAKRNRWTSETCGILIREKLHVFEEKKHTGRLRGRRGR